MKPPVVAPGLARWILTASLLACVAGCASLSVAAPQCGGDPCASLSCPSAFICSVDARCVARCQPEPAKAGMP